MKKDRNIKWKLLKDKLKECFEMNTGTAFAQFTELVLEISNSTGETNLENIINDIGKTV